MKTAILIIGYNRPDLFKQVVTSVKNNNSDYPKYISLDNCGDDSIIKKHIDICRENFPTFSFELRNKRFRQDIHIFQSLKTVFDMGYDRVIYLEDDTLISDNGIKLLDNILNWTDSCLKNVGMAQLWSNRVFTDDDIIKDENVLAYTGENLWGAIIKKECWFSCLPVIEKYMEELDYKDFTKIRAMLANMDVNIRGIPESYKNELMKDFVLGWDGFFHKLYMSKGWRRVSTMIPRCINIGKDGQNSCEEAWNALGYGKVKLYQDVNIPTEFKFINEEY